MPRASAFSCAGVHDGRVGFDLERFVTAQQGIFDGALAELRAGRKTSHWMWFVFPQLAGLGESWVSRHYAISSLDEARAYLAHPVLGPRLRTCCALVQAAKARSAEEIFGDTDAMKLRSSVTLFMRAAPREAVFGQVLGRFWAGVPDAPTDALLGA